MNFLSFVLFLSLAMFFTSNDEEKTYSIINLGKETEFVYKDTLVLKESPVDFSDKYFLSLSYKSGKFNFFTYQKLFTEDGNQYYEWRSQNTNRQGKFILKNKKISFFPEEGSIDVYKYKMISGKENKLILIRKD